MRSPLRWLVGFAALAGAAPPGVVLYHLEKAGGTAVHAELAMRMGGADISIVRESNSFTPQQLSPQNFRIGLMREPCAYCASVYFWGGTHREGYLRRTLRATAGRKAFAHLYPAEPSAASFRRWLEYVNAPPQRGGDALGASPRCGLASMRLWTQVVRPEKLWPLNEDLLAKHPRRKCNQTTGFLATHLQCVEDMQHFKFRHPFDCWLRTDNLKPDFEQCAQRFLKRGGKWSEADTNRRPPVMPWEARGAANSSTVFGASAAADETFADRRNTQSYLTCAELFVDANRPIGFLI
ncbi:hypothetical protein M885DRAFT_588419 [Pelagophyceae sp. CCMP2097]|nr:hypothetical protein M885DRAFT_588419 [Pelagophyceae sp. CCMP2097]